MPRMVEPPNSVLLLVGREQFTPPTEFGGLLCAATPDCIAIGVASVNDSPTTVDFVHSPPGPDTALMRLGEFVVQTEGLLSLRDVYNREYEAVGMTPGEALVTVWGNDDSEPDNIVLEVADARPRAEQR